MSFPQVCGKIERKRPQKLKKGTYLRFPNFIKSHFLSFWSFSDSHVSNITDFLSFVKYCVPVCWLDSEYFSLLTKTWLLIHSSLRRQRQSTLPIFFQWFQKVSENCGKTVENSVISMCGYLCWKGSILHYLILFEIILNNDLLALFAILISGRWLRDLTLSLIHIWRCRRVP